MKGPQFVVISVGLLLGGLYAWANGRLVAERMRDVPPQYSFLLESLYKRAHLNYSVATWLIASAGLLAVVGLVVGT